MKKHTIWWWLAFALVYLLYIIICFLIGFAMSLLWDYLMSRRYRKQFNWDFSDGFRSGYQQYQYQQPKRDTYEGSRAWACDILGVTSYATPEDIKKAYRQKSRENHPDLGGDQEAMKDINRAYDILSK